MKFLKAITKTCAELTWLDLVILFILLPLIRMIGLNPFINLFILIAMFIGSRAIISYAKKS
jgi:hypothetical protein